MRILISGENEPISKYESDNILTGEDLMSQPENIREKVEILPGKQTNVP